MLKGDICTGVIQKGKSSCSAILINLGANRFVEARKVKSYFDLLKLKRTKTIDVRIVPLLFEENDLPFNHINYGMVEEYFPMEDMLKPIRLKKVKELR